MTRHLRPAGASAALAVVALTAMATASATAATPPRTSAGTTLAQVTQQAIAASGHRQHNATGAVTGNTVDGRATAAQAQRVIKTKKKTTRTTTPSTGRVVTPAAALRTYGLLTPTAITPPRSRPSRARRRRSPRPAPRAPPPRGKTSPSRAPPHSTRPSSASPSLNTWDNFALKMPAGPVGAVHSVVLATGKVLIIAGSGNNYAQFAAGQFRSWLWDPDNTDPATAFRQIATPYDMFCAGHVQLADGTPLIAGGTLAYPQYADNGDLLHDWDGSEKSYIFNIKTNQYEAVGSMANARWYPGMVQRGDGTVLSVGGLDDRARALGVVSHNTDTVEQYNPSTKTWSNLPTLNFSTTDPIYPVPAGPVGTTRTLPYYPGLVQLEDGRIFYSGQSNGDNGVRPGVDRRHRAAVLWLAWPAIRRPGRNPSG